METITGHVRDVGDFDWGRGALIKDSDGNVWIVRASKEMTIELAKRLYGRRLSVVGNRSADGGFVVDAISEN